LFQFYSTEFFSKVFGLERAASVALLDNLIKKCHSLEQQKEILAAQYSMLLSKSEEVMQKNERLEKEMESLKNQLSSGLLAEPKHPV
tara:strand:+ start:341 stop:601 length:261 start_codon:yes stop_codon:yes gene_type:complete